MSNMSFKAILIVSLLGLFVIAQADTDPNRFDEMLGKSWYGLYLQGSKVGFMELSLEKVHQPMDGWRLESALTLSIGVGGGQSTMTTCDVREFSSPDGALYSSILTISSPTGDVVITGGIEDHHFIVESQIGGQVKRKIFDYPIDHLDSLLSVDIYIASGQLER